MFNIMLCSYAKVMSGQNEVVGITVHLACGLALSRKQLKIGEK
jgi:hypothetical protein